MGVFVLLFRCLLCFCLSQSFKPEIVVYNFDRDFVATKIHLTDLFARYGSPVALLSLIKKEEKTPQETRLGMAFNQAVQRVQAQFRMEKLQKEMAEHTASPRTSTTRAKTGAPHSASDFATEQNHRDKIAAMQAAIHAREALPFPTAPVSSSSSAAHHVGPHDLPLGSCSPPFNHPSYEANSILYCTYDFLGQRARQGNVLKDLRGLVSNLVEEIGVFTFVAKQPPPLAAEILRASSSASPSPSAPAPSSASPSPSPLDAPAPAPAPGPALPALNSTPLQQAILQASVRDDNGFNERSVVSVQKGVIRVNCIDW